MFLQHPGISRSSSSEQAAQNQSVIGFPVSVLSFEDQVKTIIRWGRVRASKVVCVSNVHMLMEGIWHSDFAKVLKNADLLTPDGMPLVWMTSLINNRAQERVAGMELMQALCAQAQSSGLSIFFFGSTPEMLSAIKQKLSQDYPDLKIAGMHSPPFRPLSDSEESAIAQEINDSGANLVFVSLGCPKQERWMHKHSGRIKGVMVGLGGAFSVYTGNQKWAPKWVRQFGLEWLYRLAQEPKRLWKRYTSTIPPFIWLASKQILKLRLGVAPDISLRRVCIRKLAKL